MLQKKITFDSFIRGILSGIVIIGILYLVNRLSGVLLPFFVAWLIAYLIYPMVTFFQYKLRLKNRVISIFAVMLVLICIGILTFIGLVPPIVEEFGKLKELLTDYFVEGSKQAAIPVVANFIKEHIDMLKINEALNEDRIAQTIRDVLPQVWAIFTQSVNVVVSIFTSFYHTALYFFFILLDYEAIAKGWIKLVPVKHRDTTIKIVNDVQEGMNKYFRGQAVVAFFVGILFSIGFLIIDFPLAIGFGLFIGLLNMSTLFTTHCFYPYHTISITQSCRYRRKFLVDIILCIFSLLHCTGHTRRIDCSQSNGENNRSEPCYHSFVLVCLGSIDGNCRNDYRLAVHQLNAFLLSTIHSYKKKRNFQ